jgi:ERCC4-type nuclease
MKLIIDSREGKVIPFFKEEYDGIKIEVKQIQIGDYAVYQGDKLLFIFERKSWVDLAASIKDGRKENVNKLFLARQETGCKIVYLIEGKARHLPAKKFARIPYKNLQSHLDHLIIRDNIFIIHSSSPEDTASRLIEFIYNFLSLHNFSTEKLCKEVEGGESGDGEPFDLTQKIPKDDLQIIYTIWCCAPSITEKTTSLFIKDYHISDLILGNISKEEIYTMKYPNGAIIGKRADKIIKITENSPENFKRYCNMLACINGITKKTAALIITKLGFFELLQGDVSLEELAALQKTEKSKIGKKIANEILRFFVSAYTPV